MSKHHLISSLVAMGFVLLLAIVAVNFTAPALSAPLAQATPTPTGTPIPSAQTGNVRVQTLNVRSGPGPTNSVIGQLRRGNSVQILGRQGDWLQIAFPAAADGKAWVFASLITVGGSTQTTTSPSGATTGSVPAPQAKGYQNNTFTWAWSGANAVGAQDWYYDIQMFRGNANLPYRVFVVEPANATLANGLYSFTSSFTPECDTFWVVQIATRSAGKFTGWISPRSERLPLGPGCPSSSHSASDNPSPTEEPAEQPTPEPNPTEEPTEQAR